MTPYFNENVSVYCVRSGLWLCNRKNLGLATQMVDTSRRVSLQCFYCSFRLLMYIWIQWHSPNRIILRFKWCAIYTEITEHYLHSIYIFTYSETRWLKLYTRLRQNFLCVTDVTEWAVTGLQFALLKIPGCYSVYYLWQYESDSDVFKATEEHEAACPCPKSATRLKTILHP